MNIGKIGVMNMSAVTDSKLDWDAFGERVAARRKKIGMSQRTLAKSIGRHQAAISSIELGKMQPTVETCFRLADSLDITVSTLLSYLNS